MQDLLRYLPTTEDVVNHLTDPITCGLEVGFLFLTLSHVFVVYRVLLDVVPYPVFVTLFQMIQGSLMAFILGECGKEFGRLAYFPRVTISRSLLYQLILPTIPYLLMILTANLLLHKVAAISAYPVLVSVAVFVHHIVRYVACGEEYLMLRWKSVTILILAFLVGCIDPNTAGSSIVLYALAYAASSAIFRAGYLQKLMHMVDGRGNILHNHQHLLGAIGLLPLVFLAGESGVYFKMPFDLSRIRTYQVWGCLVVCGFLPFAKNVVSNRLIKRTGQAPWRIIEVISIVMIFTIGLFVSRRVPNIFGAIALLLTLAGRALCAVDVQANAEIVQQMEKAANRPPAASNEPYYQAAP